MFADNFFCVVAHHARRAGVPADDVARRVELKNAVLLNALDEQAEALFALAQGALGAPLVRNVLKGNSQEIVEQGKHANGVDAFADELIAVSNLTEVSWLSGLESIQARNGKLSFQEFGKICEGFAPQIF